MILQKHCSKCGGSMNEVFTRYITRNGKKVFPVRAKFFRFFACGSCRNKK